MVFRYSLPPSSALFVPSRTIASPGERKADVVTWSRSSTSPTMPMVGVG
jgi:hypothetical protein